MGSAKIDLTQLELGKAEDIILPLNDVNHPERSMGEILINLTLWPRSQEDKEMVSKTNWINKFMWVIVSHALVINLKMIIWKLNLLPPKSRSIKLHKLGIESFKRKEMTEINILISWEWRNSKNQNKKDKQRIHYTLQVMLI